MPSRLLRIVTSAKVFKRGSPFVASGTNAGPTTVLTRFTPGSSAILAVSGVTGAPEFWEKTDRVKSDGLVLARNAGYDYWVRRARR